MTLIARWAARARESLFFLPTVVVLLCAAAAWLAVVLDHSEDALEQIPLILTVTADGGRAIATTVAGATITVAAIVFSITALTSQMASSQYSPRSVGGFFEDPVQQLIIGLVVGTFTYSLLILASLGTVLDATDPLPSFAITLDIVLGIASAIAIVGYLDHSLRRMQIDSVVFRIARTTVEAVRAEHQHDDGPEEFSSQGQPEGAPLVVDATRSGWVVGISPARLLQSLPESSTARVNVRVGEPVSEGDQIVTIWPTPENASETIQGARRAIGLATKRSISGDSSFGIRQLVDIGLRALSPGVNDPTTAVDVIHHLKVPVREILLLPSPERVFNGRNGKQVFLAATLSRSDYVREAFSEIRLAARGQLYVLRALIEVLEDLATEMRAKDLEGRLSAVETELELTVETAKSSGFPDSDLRLLLATRRLKEKGEDEEPE